MEALEKYKQKIQFNENELEDVIHIIFNYTNINSDYKRSSTINKKEKMIDAIIPLFEKCLELDIPMDRNEKISIINTLDKFHFRKEILEIFKKNIDLKDIEKAGIRLGKKSQSSFWTGII